jgi:hypothetical protein
MGTRAVLVPHQCARRSPDLDNNALLLCHCTYDPNLLFPLLLHRMVGDAEFGKNLNIPKKSKQKKNILSIVTIEKFIASIPNVHPGYMVPWDYLPVMYILHTGNFLILWFWYLNVGALGLQALNVYVPDWESNGRMWPHIHNRFLAALLVSQITALGYFAVKQFPYTVFLIFPILATFAFYLFCKRNFYPSFAVVSLSVASQPAKEIPSTAAIVEAYTPTCLLENEKFEDAEFQDARSNMTSRSNSGITSPAERNV